MTFFDRFMIVFLISMIPAKIKFGVDHEYFNFMVDALVGALFALPLAVIWNWKP